MLLAVREGIVVDFCCVVQEYEELRKPERVLKDELSPAPIQRRREILLQSMDPEHLERRYKEELQTLNRIRQDREHSVSKDKKHHPEFGTLRQNVDPTSADFSYDDDDGANDDDTPSKRRDGRNKRGRKRRGRGRGRGRTRKRKPTKPPTATTTEVATAAEEKTEADPTAPRNSRNISPQRSKRARRGTHSIKKVKQPLL